MIAARSDANPCGVPVYHIWLANDSGQSATLVVHIRQEELDTPASLWSHYLGATSSSLEEISGRARHPNFLNMINGLCGKKFTELAISCGEQMPGITKAIRGEAEELKRSGP